MGGFLTNFSRILRNLDGASSSQDSAKFYRPPSGKGRSLLSEHICSGQACLFCAGERAVRSGVKVAEKRTRSHGRRTQ
jgi:hypothetical protein